MYWDATDKEESITPISYCLFSPSPQTVPLWFEDLSQDAFGQGWTYDNDLSVI